MTDAPVACFPPEKGRAHEVCGACALGFACIVCAHVDGPILWVVEGWRPEQVNPAGFRAFADPGQLLLARARSQNEMLAVAEEALRAGEVALVVMELGRPLDLTAGRRLQLAAKAGKTIALCIIPEGMGSNAAQTRWRCQPLFDPDDSTLQRWELIKNKSGTFGAWDIRWDAEARRIIVVSEAGERSGAPGQAE